MAKAKIIDNPDNQDSAGVEAAESVTPEAPIATIAPAVAEVQSVEVKAPATPLPPSPNAQCVYYSSFSQVLKPCTAFIDSVNKDGTVNLVALVMGEQPPCVAQKSVHYANPGKPGSWNWGL